jgi:hypothetical protein
MKKHYAENFNFLNENSCLIKENTSLIKKY